ncbi:MAG: phosphohydrolase, partial [Desulfuromonadales bacterium]|nr:phosphohydrolase [Desulfuromonadales bacterium]
MTKEEKSKSQLGRASFFAGGLQGLRNQRQNRFEGWLLVVVVLLLTLIIVPKGGLIPNYYIPGDIATRDIKSPRDLLIEDVPLTEAKRIEAADNSPVIYGFDTTAGVRTTELVRQSMRQLTAPQNDTEKLAAEELLLRLEFELGISLTPDEVEPLLELSANQNVVVLTADLLQPTFELPIVANLQKFKTDRDSGIVVVDNLEGNELALRLFAETISLNDALTLVGNKLQQVAGITLPQQQILLKLVQQQLQPSLVFNQIETDRRQVSASEQVAPVLFQVKKGEMVVREGARVTADQILKLQAIRDSGRDNRSLQTAAGLSLCSLLLIYVGFYFAKRNISKFCPDSRDLLFLAGVFLTLFVLVKISIFIAAGVGNNFAYIDSTAYLYAIPFALGAMLVRIVLNSETAFLFSVCCAVLIGVLFGNSLLMALYVLTGSLVGAHGVRHCQRRTTLYSAGLWIGLTNVAMLIGIHFLSGRNLELQLLWNLGFGMFGGLASAIIVNGTIPLVESLFKYTTDIKLLELANMNAPILRQLM